MLGTYYSLDKCFLSMNIDDSAKQSHFYSSEIRAKPFPVSVFLNAWTKTKPKWVGMCCAISELSFNLESPFHQNFALWGQKEAMVTGKIIYAHSVRLPTQGDIRGGARSLPNWAGHQDGHAIPAHYHGAGRERLPLQLPATHWWGCAYYNVGIISTKGSLKKSTWRGLL